MTIGRDRVDAVVLLKRGVRFAVGDVRAEPPFSKDDRLPRRRIRAELFQRRRRRALAAPSLRLREQGKRFIEGGREKLLLVLERAAVASLLDVRAVPAVQRHDLLAVGGIDSHDARQVEQLERVLESDRFERHRLEQ